MPREANFRVNLEDTSFKKGADRVIRRLEQMEKQARETGDAIDKIDDSIAAGGGGRGGGSGRGGGGRGSRRSGGSIRFSTTDENIRDTYEFRRRDIERLNKLQEQANRKRLQEEKAANRKRLQEDKYHARLRVESERLANKTIEDDLKRTAQAVSKYNKQRQQEEKYASRLRQQSIREEQAALKRFEVEANRARRSIEVGLLELFFTLHSLSRPIDLITDAIARFTFGNIEASRQMEKFSSTMRIINKDIGVAERNIARLLDITIDLAAIDTPGLIQFSARLQTAGLSAKESENAIVAVTKRMEEQGKGASETRRVLEQFTQAINANIITMQDFRPILREYPTLYKDFSDAMGVTITDLDSLRDAADLAGGATNLIARSLGHVSQVAQGAELNTINRQLDEFNDRVFVLRAALGDSLRPAIVEILKIANRFLDWLSNLNENVRTSIGIISILAVVFGKTLHAAIQIAITAIAGFQLQAAVEQVRIMSQVAQGLNAQMGIVGAQSIQMSKHFQNMGGYINIATKGLKIFTGAFVALSFIIPVVYIAIRELTRHTREMREEQERFVSTALKIPSSINEGSQAIRRQIEELREYSAEVSNSIKEIRQLGERRRQAARQTEAGGFVDAILTPEDLEGGQPIIGRKEQERLDQFNNILLETRRNMRDLNIIMEDGAGRFQALGRVAARTRDDLHNAIQSGDVANIIKFANAYDLLVDTVNRWRNEIRQLPEEFRNLEQEIVILDFTVRRLERSFSNIDLEKLVGDFGFFDASGLENNINKTIESLRNISEIEKQLERERFEAGEKSVEDKLIHAAAIERIEQALAFDIENLELSLQESLDKLRDVATKKRMDRADLYFRFLKAGLDDRLKAEKIYYDAIESLEVARLNSQLSRAQDGNNLQRQIQIIRRLSEIRKQSIREEIKDKDLLSLELEKITLETEDRIYNIRKSYTDKINEYIENQNESRIESIKNIASEFGNLNKLLNASNRDISRFELGSNQFKSVNSNIKDITDSFGEYTDAFRKASDETEKFSFQQPENRFIPRVGRSTPLDPEDLTGEFERRVEQQEEYEKKVEESVSRAENLRVSVSRQFSRLATDLAFNIDKSATDIVLSFAESTARIILQATIEAEIRKRISDKTTAHIIANNAKIAAAQGATSSAGAAASVSSVAGLASGGIGSVALVGLAIAPFLVRAIKDGFSDTKVELDKREVGKVTANSVKDLIRSGEVRP